ncbi:MAG: hypothetical protein E7E21_05070 [Peptostreptococcaceae bacterium]|jgi:hypothetical protein|nr:hypothetical protein [Peptostreptococcaceae bacterium]
MDTISMSEARKILEVTNGLVRTLAITKDEMIELMQVYNKIIDRLLKESVTNE